MCDFSIFLIYFFEVDQFVLEAAEQTLLRQAVNRLVHLVSRLDRRQAEVDGLLPALHLVDALLQACEALDLFRNLGDVLMLLKDVALLGEDVFRAGHRLLSHDRDWPEEGLLLVDW